MTLNFVYFIVSFLGDVLAYIFYQKYLDSHKKDMASLLFAVISAFLVWFMIFKLQDRGQILRVFMPLWASGSAVFGYLAGGLFNKTPLKELLNIQALLCIVAIGVGIYFLQRLSA